MHEIIHFLAQIVHIGAESFFRDAGSVNGAGLVGTRGKEAAQCGRGCGVLNLKSYFLSELKDLCTQNYNCDIS